MSLQERLSETAAKTLVWTATRKQFQGRWQNLQTEIQHVTEESQTTATAQKVLEDLLQQCSGEAKVNLEKFLSFAMQKIFNKASLAIEIHQETKRDRTETKILLREGKIVGPPSKVAGGGYQNVIGFLLRFLALKKLNCQQILILDEAFRNVSTGHLDTLNSFLKHLAADHKIDILLVTHEEKFESSADRLYAVAKVDDVLTITHQEKEGQCA